PGARALLHPRRRRVAGQPDAAAARLLPPAQPAGRAAPGTLRRRVPAQRPHLLRHRDQAGDPRPGPARAAAGRVPPARRRRDHRGRRRRLGAGRVLPHSRLPIARRPVMKALVIDDSRAMRRIVAGQLQTLGFETVEAGDGRQALEAMAAPDGGFDLACVDWNMPVMDGLTFVQRVRANRDWRRVTLMMVTTESEHGQVVRALAAGAHEYLIKPFTPDALVAK